jgi:hypothetical protein
MPLVPNKNKAEHRHQNGIQKEEDQKGRQETGA